MVESNIKFDQYLKGKNPLWGVRDLTYVESMANKHGLHLESKHEMPSNNLTLVFKKK